VKQRVQSQRGRMKVRKRTEERMKPIESSDQTFPKGLVSLLAVALAVALAVLLLALVLSSSLLSSRHSSRHSFLFFFLFFSCLVFSFPSEATPGFVLG